MTYRPSVSSRITRNTTSVEGATFNYPLFCAPHMYFRDTERVRAYSTWDSIKADTDIPEGSDVYNAARLAFSQEPSPEIFYVGRQEADSVTLTPSVVGNLLDYGFSVEVKETSTGTVVSTAVTITSDADATADEIATALFTAADTGGSEVENVTVTDETGSVKLVPATGYTVQLKATERLSDSFESTETAAELLTAILDEEDDWYFMTWSDHTQASQLAMAAEIEATGSTNKPKMYFTSTASADSVVSVVDPAIDIIGMLKALGYDRTTVYWQDTADTLFPETGCVAYNGVYQAGTTTWKFMQVVGMPVAADLVTGKKLSTNKQGFIEDRNGNWMGIERGVKFTKEGKTVSGEWIDIIRATDWLNDQIEVALLNLLLNQKGGKIPMTDKGIAQVTNTIDTVLKSAADLGILSGYIPASAPDAIDIAFADKVARILENIKWTGYLAGAVHTIVVDGNLTYQQAELV